MAKTKRMSMTLPIELVDELDSISSTFNVSRSSLVSQILIDAIEPLKEVLSLSVSMIERTDGKDAATLARNPELVREYLDSLKLAVDSRKKNLDEEMSDFMEKMGDSRHGH